MGTLQSKIKLQDFLIFLVLLYKTNCIPFNLFHSKSYCFRGIIYWIVTFTSENHTSGKASYIISAHPKVLSEAIPFSGTCKPEVLAWQQPENIMQQDQSYQSSWLRGGDQRPTEQLEHEQTKQQGHKRLVWRTMFWRRYCYFLQGGRKFTLNSDRKHALNSATQSEHS